MTDHSQEPNPTREQASRDMRALLWILGFRLVPVAFLISAVLFTWLGIITSETEAIMIGIGVALFFIRPIVTSIWLRILHRQDE